MKIEIPKGFRQVAQDEFFAALYGDSRDIMPRNGDPTFTTWETRDRHVWGLTTPGWKYPGEEKIYAVKA